MFKPAQNIWNIIAWVSYLGSIGGPARSSDWGTGRPQNYGIVYFAHIINITHSGLHFAFAFASAIGLVHCPEATGPEDYLVPICSFISSSHLSVCMGTPPQAYCTWLRIYIIAAILAGLVLSPFVFLMFWVVAYRDWRDTLPFVISYKCFRICRVFNWASVSNPSAFGQG